MIDGRNFFDQPVKNDKITYEDICKLYNWLFTDYHYLKKNIK